MKGGAQGRSGGAMVMVPNNDNSNNNFMSQLLKSIKEVEDGIDGYRNWLRKLPLPVEAAVVTTTNVIGGAALGALFGTLPNNNPVFSVFRGGPLLQARDLAVMQGVEACVSCVVERIKGKKDHQNW
ncbi:hypothetical protein MKX01_010331 [Papaver californicum]|nr:hypothetical protein MKX01_010331 [Papaver californicum]